MAVLNGNSFCPWCFGQKSWLFFFLFRFVLPGGVVILYGGSGKDESRSEGQEWWAMLVRELRLYGVHPMLTIRHVPLKVLAALALFCAGWVTVLQQNDRGLSSVRGYWRAPVKSLPAPSFDPSPVS